MSEILSHPIPAVIGLLGLLVFVHEFGHYAVGRMMGIAAEIFSIGFGPKIVGWRYKGTDFRLCWVPLGGYVKFAGAHPAEDLPADMVGSPYRDASIGARALTIAAGPLANLLLAAAVFALLGYVGIPHPPPLIGEVIDGSRAEASGLRPGDQVVEIEGKEIKTWRELEQKVASSPELPLQIKVQRLSGLEKVTVPLTVTPAEVPMPGSPQTKIGRAGIALGQLPSVVSVRFPDSPAHKAGLVTGDRVKAIKLGDQETLVSSYWEFREALASLIRSPAFTNGGKSEVILKVASTSPAPIFGKDATKNQAKTEPNPSAGPAKELEKEVTLPLQGLLLEPKTSSREILEVLGIDDAQLALGEIPPKYEALKARDIVVRFASTPIKNIYQLREALIAYDKPQVTLGVIRGGVETEVPVELEPIEVQKLEGKAIHYGFPVGFWVQLSEPPPYIEQYGLVSAVGFGVAETGRQVKEMTANLVQLVSGKIPMKALGGPMLIAKVAGDSAKRGWQTFLGALALISINLGVLNLIPIPVLDGGQLLMVAWEGVRRRPLNDMALENFQKVGFAMILALVVLATYNDLSRFWLSMLSSVVGIFK